MSTYLMARIVEGTDTWHKYDFKRGTASFSFSDVNNESLAIVSQCNQKGFDALYNIGKTLWDKGMCTKFEIAAFDGDELFWKTQPDQWNFERGRYDGWFDSMISEELQSFHSEDFQNDKLEMEYITDYQNRFWKDRDSLYGTDSFVLLLNDTGLYEDLSSIQQWIENPENNVPESCGFVYNGQKILNPFYDETLRFDVEPLSYYGTTNIMTFINRLKEHISAQPLKHKPLDDKIHAAEQHKSNHSNTQAVNSPSMNRE